MKYMKSEMVVNGVHCPLHSNLLPCLGHHERREDDDRGHGLERQANHVPKDELPNGRVFLGLSLLEEIDALRADFFLDQGLVQGLAYLLSPRVNLWTTLLS